jgi:drug/metabolite transporter (DMT)-like permease
LIPSFVKSRSRLLDYGTVAFLATVWGLSWPFTIVALRDSDPLMIASLRSIIGGIGLWAWRARSTSKEPLSGRLFWVTFVVGTCWVGIPMALTAWALQYISGGLGSIFQSTTPFFVAIFAYFMLREPQLSAAKIFGLIIGFIGIILLFSDDTGEPAGGSAVVAGAAVLLTSVLIGFAQVYSRKYFKGRDLLGFNMYVLLIAGFETLPFCFVGGAPRFSLTTDLVLSILYLGMMASAIPFVLYFELFQRVNIVVLSMVSYLIPVVAVISGILWLGERLSPTDVLGACLVLFGVLLATQYHMIKSKLHTRLVSKRMTP